MIIKALDTLIGQSAARRSSIEEGRINAIGSTSTTYDVEFKNGVIAKEVTGLVGLTVGQTVTLGAYSGQSKRFVILGTSYRADANLVTVNV